MRLVLLTWCALLLVCTVGSAQAGKKSGTANDSAKVPREVDGKTVMQWTREFDSRDPSKREHAMRMVMMFPANQAKQAVGPLIKELEKHSTTRPIDLSVRISGCVAIGTILSSIPPPEKDKEEDKADLKHVEDAVKLLRGFCKDSQVIVKTRAVQALAQLARRYPTLVTPALDEANLVADDLHTWEARQAGLETLTMLAIIKAYQNKDKGGALLPSKVWATYQSRLSDNSQEVRLTALKSLAQFSQPPATLDKVSLSKVALLKHIEALAQSDPVPTIRIWAHLTLMTLKHQIDKQQLQPIVGLLDDPKQTVSVRLQAAQALGMIGGQLQGLKTAKKKPEVEPKIGEGVTKFIFDSLVTTLRDKDAGLVTVGMNALAQTDPVLAVGPVVDILRRKDPPELRTEAAKVLAMIGKQAEPGLKGSGVRQAVFTAIQQTTLGDSDSDVVALGMNALGHADPVAAIDPVVNILLHGKEPSLRAEAAKVLAGIAVTMRAQKKSLARSQAEGALIEKLKDQQAAVVVNCINALVQMDSESAIPALEVLSRDPGQQEIARNAATEAIKMIREHNNKKPQPKGKVAPR